LKIVGEMKNLNYLCTAILHINHKQRRCPRLKGINFIGYTHYWNLNRKKVTPEQFYKAVEEIKKIYANLPKRTNSAGGNYPKHLVKIMGGLGKGEPVFNETKIWFNGNAKNSTEHETMMINLKEDDAWDFCKTARKPYDLLVCCSLIALANNLPTDDFSFSSDGGTSDWQPALDLYTEIIGKPQAHVLERINGL
jgi:hypothetical protein